MSERLRRSLRAWVPLCACLAAGCGIPRYGVFSLQADVRDWEADRLVGAGGRLYASDVRRTTVIEIDPATLAWTERARPEDGFLGFDVDADGLIVAGTGRLEREGAPAVAFQGAAYRAEWTARHAVLIGDALTFVPKGGGVPASFPLGRGTALLGVDYVREQAWARVDGALASAGPGDVGWIKHEALPAAWVLDFAAQDGRLCFIEHGRVRAGPSWAESRELPLPGGAWRLAFNGRGAALLLVWTDEGLWSWDFAVERAERLGGPEGQAWRSADGSVVRVRENRIWREGAPEGEVRVRLDAGKRVANFFVRLIGFPIDAPMFLVTFATPVGLLCQGLELADSLEEWWGCCRGGRR